MNLFRTSLRRFSAMSAQLPASSSPFTRAVVNSMRKLSVYTCALNRSRADVVDILSHWQIRASTIRAVSCPNAPGEPHRITNQQSTPRSAVQPPPKTTKLRTLDNRPHQSSRRRSHQTKRFRDSSLPYASPNPEVLPTYQFPLPDPIIFRGLKSLTLNDTQQQSLLRLAQEGISVYSPHTAVDAAPSGMGDWLADMVTGSIQTTSSPKRDASETSSRHYSQPQYPALSSKVTSTSDPIPHDKATIIPSAPPLPKDFESAGMGRLVTFSTPQPLTAVIENIAQGTGYPGGIPIAIPHSASVDKMPIRTVGVCPGSGSSILIKGTGGNLPDLLLTGELSHHEALAVTERGSAVIALAHSNTERGYLPIMRDYLLDALKKEWEIERQKTTGAFEESTKQAGSGLVEGLDEAVKDYSVAVDVSLVDRDPYGIMVRTG